MNQRHLSCLARPLEPAYPTNLAVLIIVPAIFLVGLLVYLLLGTALLGASLAAARIALSAFIAWALAREIDPDHDYSAFVAMLLGIAAALRFPGLNLLVAFWLMAILRVLNRTTGLSARWTDTLIIAGFSLWLAWSFDWLLGVAAGVTLLLDGYLAEPLKRHRLVGLALILAGLSLAWIANSAPHRLQTEPLLAVGALVIGLPLILRSRTLRSVCDVTGQPLNGLRIQAAQLIAFMTAGALLTRVHDGLQASVLILASLLGAGLYTLALLVVKKGGAFQDRAN